MDPEKECRQMLKQHGEKVRHNKHEAFKVNGQLIVITNTRTDFRGWLNKRAEIRRALRCNGR